MLETRKSTTLTGTIKVENGGVEKQVVYLTANITENGSDSSNQTIQDKELYQLNKAKIRKDIAAFNEEVYTIQDELSNKETSTSETTK